MMTMTKKASPSVEESKKKTSHTTKAKQAAAGLEINVDAATNKNIDNVATTTATTTNTNNKKNVVGKRYGPENNDGRIYRFDQDTYDVGDDDDDKQTTMTMTTVKTTTTTMTTTTTTTSKRYW